MHFTLTSAHVQHQAATRLRTALHLTDYGSCCPVATVLAVVFAACCRLCSLFAATRRLRRAPSFETLRQAVLANLPDLAKLEDRLNQALRADWPRHSAWPRQRLAIDLILIPYHGQPESEASELYRGQVKSGTSHFHAYATAYLVRAGQRLTLALTVVRQGEKLERVLQRLLRRCRPGGGRPGLLLLDRGFWTVGVIRYLQAARCPFLMPVIARGRRAGAPGGPGGTRVFWGYRRGGWGAYTLRETGGGRAARVSIAVHVRNRAGRRGKHGREHLVYAYWGWQPKSVAGVSAVYRQRFGIESSYRQLNEARVTTCTRSVRVRLFLVGVALVLRNVWVGVHHEVLATPRRGQRQYHPERLRFQDLLLMLLHEAERLLGIGDEVGTERPIPKNFTADDLPHAA
jgi:putative transposase